VAERNYSQAWRNISSITGTRAGQLAVTTRAITPVANAKDPVTEVETPQDIPYTADGGVFICHDANLPADVGAAQMQPAFDLMFTHPYAAAAAFYDRPGGERLFVALNTYGRLEANTADLSITPITNYIDDGCRSRTDRN
jgi:hypothetical protein